MLVVAFLLTTGCHSPGSVKEALSAKTEVKPSDAVTITKTTVSNCMNEHSEKDRRYCECYANELHQRMSASSGIETSKEKGQMAMLSAMACKRLQ
ncbi:MAG: hypothetical protein HQM16_04490 [Deltaproteobacteria bacterium]|nr:hypothetical protein [Deltaproteobacteria bacterium]